MSVKSLEANDTCLEGTQLIFGVSASERIRQKAVPLLYGHGDEAIAILMVVSVG